MKLSKLLEKKSGDIVTIDSNKTIADAIELLIKHNFGCLLVTDKKKKLEGIITERDILFKCSHDGIDKHKLKIADVMTAKENLIVGTADDTLSYAMKVMINHRVRHLPLIDDTKLIGLLSIGDILKEVLDQSESEVKLLKNFITNPYGINI